jgi:hypothetical protein
MDKYEDVAEALKTVLTLTIIPTAIVGLAPMLIILQTAF